MLESLLVIEGPARLCCTIGTKIIHRVILLVANRLPHRDLPKSPKPKKDIEGGALIILSEEVAHQQAEGERDDRVLF
jgi:hypothetical protein